MCLVVLADSIHIYLCLKFGYLCLCVAFLGHVPELVIYLNEYALELDRHNLWIGAEDNDSHCPLIVRLKPTGWQNVRKVCLPRKYRNGMRRIGKD